MPALPGKVASQKPLGFAPEAWQVGGVTNDIAIRLQQLVTAPGPAHLGPATRPGTRSVSELERELKSIGLPANSVTLVKALLLLWHDHLDASHTISQAIENRDGSLVHAIMHRREPDYWNSKYWWRRVGDHPCFPELARSAGEFLRRQQPGKLAAQLTPGGRWNADALVDLCESAAGEPPESDRVRMLRAVQQIETQVALQHFVGPEFPLEFALP